MTTSTPSDPASPRPSARRAPHVLYVGARHVEWLDRSAPDAPRLVRRDSGGERPEDFAAAALEAVREAGTRDRRCVVVLAGARVRNRLLHLPELPRKQLRGVLERKAARELDVEPEEALFSAREVDPEGRSAAPSDGALATWLLAATRRDFVLGLAAALRDRGLVVRRVTGPHQAAASLAPERVRSSGEEGAVIGITVDEQVTSVALVALADDATLLAQYVLDGDYLESPSLGANLLQVVRNAAAFWRKLSRGEPLAAVVCVGLDAERGPALCDAVSHALEDVPAERSAPRDASWANDPVSGRIELLEACAGSGPFLADLTPRLPVAPRRAALSLAVVATALVGVVGLTLTRVSARIDELGQQTSGMLRRTAELEELETRLGGLQEEAGGLAVQVERLRDIRSRGIPLARLVASSQRAFEGRARLDGIRSTRLGNGAHGLTISGTTALGPREMVVELRAARDELASELGLRDAHVVPPRSVGDAGDRGDGLGLPFTVEGELGGTP